MPTIPVYIRNSNKQFLTEEEPSELINTLLKAHYEKGTHTPFKKAETFKPSDSCKHGAAKGFCKHGC